MSRPTPPPPASARAAAVRAIEVALAGRGYVDDLLAEAGARDALGARDAALAAELSLGVVRHAETLEHVLGAVARYRAHATSPALRAVLLVGAYQIIWLDRVPVFAAVNESVELARSVARPAAARMVNAILRNLARAVATRRTSWRVLDPTLVRVEHETACAFDRPVLPDPAGSDEGRAYWAAATGERPAHFRALVTRHGLDAAIAIGWARQATPPAALHRNPLRCDGARFARAVAERYGAAAELCGDVAFIGAGHSPVDNAVFVDGGAWVQDPTAHAAARLGAPRPGERVLDLCAAPGGKTLALAVAMQDRGELIACDVNPGRLRSVARNLARLDLYCARPLLMPGGPADRLPDDPALRAPFDLVLVDAPCSNTGVIARRPEARWTLTAGKLDSLRTLQRGLLERGATATAAGGRLVYSTCSIEPGENEELVGAFLAARPDWRLVQETLTLPAWGVRLSAWRDGGYAALLRRGPAA